MLMAITTHTEQTSTSQDLENSRTRYAVASWRKYVSNKPQLIPSRELDRSTSNITLWKIFIRLPIRRVQLSLLNRFFGIP
jgi:hypothetical protein